MDNLYISHFSTYASGKQRGDDNTVNDVQRHIYSFPSAMNELAPTAILWLVFRKCLFRSHLGH
jgi:hypothetical protein